MSEEYRQQERLQWVEALSLHAPHRTDALNRPLRTRTTPVSAVRHSPRRHRSTIGYVSPMQFERVAESVTV